jgi:hypothetical protein
MLSPERPVRGFRTRTGLAAGAIAVGSLDASSAVRGVLTGLATLDGLALTGEPAAGEDFGFAAARVVSLAPGLEKTEPADATREMTARTTTAPAMTTSTRLRDILKRQT